VHRFAVDDQDLPQISEVNAELRRLSMQMSDVQYVANTKFVSLDLEEEEKVSRLWNHSEKLAIA
jgi:hypothetical protein